MSQQKKITHPSGTKRNAVASDKQGPCSQACTTHHFFIYPFSQNTRRSVFEQIPRSQTTTRSVRVNPPAQLNLEKKVSYTISNEVTNLQVYPVVRKYLPAAVNVDSDNESAEEGQ